MSAICNEIVDFLERRRELGAIEAAEWQDHLDSCASCSEQAAADAALGMAFPVPPPELEEGFELRLRGRLHERETARTAGSGLVGGLRNTARWMLGAYGIAATLASLLILASAPWQASLPETPGVVVAIALGAAALVGPIILLDRRGVILPPGG